MQAKNVLYAAVGAPVVVARKVTSQVAELKEKVSKETSNYTQAANKTIDGWATEGEKLVSRLSEGKVVEEISQKVDLDQAKTQVGKLRDQLEDMLATWRSSFRPEEADAAKTGEKTASEKPAAKSKSTSPKASSAKTTKSSTAGKKSTAKSTSTKDETSNAKAS